MEYNLFVSLHCNQKQTSNKRQNKMEAINKMYLEDTIERIKILRDELNRNEHRIIMGGNPDMRKKLNQEVVSIIIASVQCGLDRLNIDRLIELDDINGLTYEYGVHVPEDHNSAEFEEWKEQEYNRIREELHRIINIIDDYLAEL